MTDRPGPGEEAEGGEEVLEELDAIREFKARTARQARDCSSVD